MEQGQYPRKVLFGLVKPRKLLINNVSDAAIIQGTAFMLGYV